MKTEIIYFHEGVSNANLTAYIQESSIDNIEIGKRPAVIICPGGAYVGITEKEAEPVALRFLSEGFHAFVLRYSIGAGMAKFPAPFIDAAQAVMILRINAERWCIDPEKICLCGFSAGGQIAAMLGATWHEEYLAKALNADNQLFKPNALILGYPLLDMHDFLIKNLKSSTDMQPLLEMVLSAACGTPNPDKKLMDEWKCMDRVTSDMPPAFLWTTTEDSLVELEQSLGFIKALAANKIPYEYHVFEKGAHGLSLVNKTVGYSDADMKKLANAHKWVELALDWLRSSQGF